MTIANTEMAPTKMELITALAQRELKFNAKLAQYFYDVSNFAVKGVKSISFPKLTSFVANDRASGAEGVLQTISSSADELLLNKNKQVLWAIDPSDEIQSTLDWEMETVKRAAGALSRQFDMDILAAALAARHEVTTTGDVTRDLVLEMIEFLEKNEANLNQIALFVSPRQNVTMLKIQQFTEQQIYGSAVIPTGALGQVYGVPVVRHHGLANGQFFMADRDGVAYGFQKNPMYDEQKNIKLGAGALMRTIDQLYGVKHLRDEEGETPVAGKSALIVGYKV